MGFCIKSDLSEMCRIDVIDIQMGGIRFEVFTFENLLLVTRHMGERMLRFSSFF